MQTKRFIPVDQEILGVVKTFCVIWLVCFFIILFGLGFGKWACWSGIGVGFIVSIPILIVVLRCTGVKE